MSDSTLFYLIVGCAMAALLSAAMTWAGRHTNGLARVADVVFQLRGRR